MSPSTIVISTQDGSIWKRYSCIRTFLSRIFFCSHTFNRIFFKNQWDFQFFFLKIGQCNRSDDECSFILSAIVLCHNYGRHVECHRCQQNSYPNYNHFDWDYMWHVGSDILLLQFIGEYDIESAVDWWYVLWMRLVSLTSEISKVDHFIHSTITKNSAFDRTWYYRLLFGCFYFGERIFFGIFLSTFNDFFYFALLKLFTDHPNSWLVLCSTAKFQMSYLSTNQGDSFI